MTIGLDIGHSTVKVAATNTQGQAVRIIFPSVVCPAITISDDAERRRAAEETVMIDGRLYFFGDTALTQGGASATTGLSEDWIAQSEHAVLLLGALRKAAAAGVAMDQPMLVLGLPTHLFARQRDRLKDTVSRLVATRDTRILPQAMGPYQAVMLTANGAAAPDRSMADESWGVVEVGHFTTDFGLIQRGRWVEKASGVCPGARVAAST